MITVAFIIWFIGLLFTVGYLMEQMKVLLRRATRGIDDCPLKDRVVMYTILYGVMTVALVIGWPVFLGEEVFARKNKKKNLGNYFKRVGK